MTTCSSTDSAPVFTMTGELGPALISALARLLISHARRELEAERVASEGRQDPPGDGDAQTRRAS